MFSAWLRERYDRRFDDDDVITINTATISKDPDRRDDLGKIIWQTPMPRFHEKADKLLLALEKEAPNPGTNITIENNENGLAWQARAWAVNWDELREIILFLIDQERIKRAIRFQSEEKMSLAENKKFVIKIAPAGWARLDQISRQFGASSIGFVAMWFDDSMKSLYNRAIKPAISDAGYEPRRIDDTPELQSDRIDHLIELTIKKSRFVVADFTGHRGGVYFEAGFARALGVPIFFTCRDDQFDDLHFDIRQFNCLRWKDCDLGKLRIQLASMIENVCGKGPHRSNN